MIQNLDGFQEVTTVEGGTQLVPGGPVASQVAIKQLGTNGGGFFNVNATHPFENPDAVTNLLSMWAMLAIPFAFPFAYGRMVRDRRQGHVLLAVMAGLWLAVPRRSHRSPRRAATRRGTELGVDQSVSSAQSGGWMEGKEVTVRTGFLRCVGGLDDRHLHRRRQLHARLDDPARRRRSPCSTCSSGRCRRAASASASPGS